MSVLLAATSPLMHYLVPLPVHVHASVCAITLGRVYIGKPSGEGGTDE